MFTKDSKKGTVRISFKPMYPVSTCEVAGDFNNWKPVEMPKDKTGQFITDMQLPAGTYQYKFILDGQWMADPDNNTVVANAYGTINSVIQIEEQKRQAQVAAQASVQAVASPPVQAKPPQAPAKPPQAPAKPPQVQAKPPQAPAKAPKTFRRAFK